MLNDPRNIEPSVDRDRPRERNDGDRHGVGYPVGDLDLELRVSGQHGGARHHGSDQEALEGTQDCHRHSHIMQLKHGVY
jgi:hypothetical protein